MQSDDLDLLREYARNQSEPAFSALVSRHVNLVYSMAMRQVRDPHLAEEITQAVFIILARKAGMLGDQTILAGWLCRTARFVGARALRDQRRRQQREQEAHMQTQIQSDPPRRGDADAETWQHIAPLLDDALESLGRKDHDALVLRFFEGKNFAEVGSALDTSEDTARMRVNRALEKLLKFFLKRGINSTTAAIAETISVNSIHAAPVALAKTVTAVAVAKGAAASTSTLTLIQGALKIMAWSKVKTITVAALAVIIGTSITTVTVKTLTRSKPVAAAYPGDWIWKPYSKSFDQVPPIFLLQPSTLPAKTHPYVFFGKNGYLARGQTVKELITAVWSQKNSAMKLVFSADLPEDKYDFIVTFQPRWWNKLESEINKQFGIVEHEEGQNGSGTVMIEKAK